MFSCSLSTVRNKRIYLPFSPQRHCLLTLSCGGLLLRSSSRLGDVTCSRLLCSSVDDDWRPILVWLSAKLPGHDDGELPCALIAAAAVWIELDREDLSASASNAGEGGGRWTVYLIWFRCSSAVHRTMQNLKRCRPISQTSLLFNLV